jgi:hypothetical protein
VPHELQVVLNPDWRQCHHAGLTLSYRRSRP